MAPQGEQCGGRPGIIVLLPLNNSPTRNRAFRGRPRVLRVSSGSTCAAIG